ncbi:MAG: NIL domain-containing protein [Candidatus Omnitrophica bacterium]|nr:NIL domain-containing protein [Candidatus Omnitrophota bacterium]
MKIALGLTFPGSLKDEAIICYMCKNFDIDVNIIEASFSMSSGWAILQIEGRESEIEKALEYLAAKEVKAQRIEIDKQEDK